MHANICFLQSNDRYQDVHQDEEYPQVLRASQRQLSQQGKKLSGRHPKLKGVMDPENGRDIK